MPVFLGTFILSFIDPLTIHLPFICFPARLHQRTNFQKCYIFLIHGISTPQQHLDNIQPTFRQHLDNLLCWCYLGLSFFHSLTLSLFLYLLYASQHGYIKVQTSRNYIFFSFMVFQPLNNIQTFLSWLDCVNNDYKSLKSQFGFLLVALNHRVG